LSDNDIRSPEHWRQRAEEARAMAEQMIDERSQSLLMDVAESYDRLADFIENAERPVYLN
jgi:hypothetical protein